VADYWWNHRNRRQYAGIVFDPESQTPDYYNLWTAFAVEPTAGDCQLYLAHIHDVVASGNDDIFDYLMAWMADAVQNPACRPGTAIVLRGKQGVGKGVFCTQFGKLFGPHFVHVQHARHLTGHFNAHLKDALVVFADEAFWAGDKTAEGALKAMVTEELLPIEFKGKDTIYVRNYIRLMIASNHDWVVPAGLEERRFFVIDISEGRMQDGEYFAAIAGQMNNGGREALLHHLQNYDLNGIDLRSYPQTDALREQKVHTMTAVQKWWCDCLTRGVVLTDDREWKTRIPCDEVQEEFCKHAQRLGYSRRSSETELGMELNKLVPSLERNRPAIRGHRTYVYDLPPLADCRVAFDQIMRMTIVWPDEPD
jgi:hypothetical protein